MDRSITKWGPYCTNDIGGPFVRKPHLFSSWGSSVSAMVESCPGGKVSYIGLFLCQYLLMITAVKISVPFLLPERGFRGIIYGQSFSLRFGT